MATITTTKPNNNLLGHPVAQSFRYNVKLGRYIDGSGRMVPNTIIRQAVDVSITSSQDSVKKLAVQLQKGEISLAQWQTATGRDIKTLHVATALVALGGSKMASQADYGYMGKLIKDQYKFLNGFANDVATGVQRLDGTFLNRVRLYVEAGRGTFHSVETREKKLAGIKLAARVLGPADSCPGCVHQAGLGYVPIDEVAPIGSQQCRTNCRCEITYQELEID